MEKIDTIIGLSLPNSPRKAKFEERLQALGMPFKILDGVPGSLITNPDLQKLTMKPMKAFAGFNQRRKFSINSLCATLSHVTAIQIAELYNYNNLLIVEDDVIFSDDFTERIKYLNDVPEDADIIYLGGITANENLNKKYKITDRIYDAVRLGLWGTHGYIIRKKAYRKVIQSMMSLDELCDSCLYESIFNKEIKAYSLIPWLLHTEYCDSLRIKNKKRNLLLFYQNLTFYAPNDNIDNMYGYDKDNKINRIEYSLPSKTKKLF